MAEKEEEVQRLMARYGKLAGINYSKPSCTNVVGVKGTIVSTAHTKLTLANQQNFVVT